MAEWVCLEMTYGSKGTTRAEKFVPSGGTLSRPCGSRTDPLLPPRRSWNTHPRFRCGRAAERPGEFWSNTSNISGDHRRTTSACTPSEAPCRTASSSTRTASGPAPSPPPPRPHPQIARPRSVRPCTGLRHCHPSLRASFPEVSFWFCAADAHGCFHPHDCLPLFRVMTGIVVCSASKLVGGGQLHQTTIRRCYWLNPWHDSNERNETNIIFQSDH